MSYKQIDVNFFESFYNGNDDFKGKMITMFMEKAPVFMSDMNSHMDQEKWVDLAASAHKFKSCIDFIGAKKLRQAAEEIEKNAKDVDTKVIADLVSNINNICDEVVIELQSELSTINT